MREIKFRCWDVERNCWLNEEDTYQQVVNQARWNPAISEHYPLMQYTGLKDKDGTEIYEGDIIRYKIKKSIITCNVAFIKYGWYPFFDKAYMMDEAEWIEVIGNNHQTPELLP